MKTTPGIRSTKLGKTPMAGDWDYDGVCVPRDGGGTNYSTFSVGVFQWVPLSKGKKVKRAKAVKRISGSVSFPQEVFDKAEAFCREMEAKIEKA